MKLKEILLSIFVLFSLIIQAFTSAPKTETAVAVAVTNPIINFEGAGELIDLFETFKDTPLITEDNIDVNYFIKSTEPIRKDGFTLSYQDLAYLTEVIMQKSTKYNIKGKVTKMTVVGSNKQAKITLVYSIETKEKNVLFKLVGVKGNSVDATINFDVDLNEKTLTHSYEIKGINMSEFIMKTACKFIFGESDYNKLIKTMSTKLFWGLGNLTEFGSDKLIFEKV